MDDDDAVVNAFIARLDTHELNGNLTNELNGLSYTQLLQVREILAERVKKEYEK